MGILDKFFNNTDTTDLNGGYTGRLEVNSSSSDYKSSDQYDYNGKYIGRIEISGNRVFRYDSNEHIISSGTYYEESDKLYILNEDGQTEIYDSNNSEKLTMFDRKGNSIYNPYDYNEDSEVDSLYNTDSCESDYDYSCYDDSLLMTYYDDDDYCDDESDFELY